MKILEVKNLHVNVGDKEILKGIDLDIFEGKVHVIMGPNGAGKSTLTNAIMAHPNYEVTKGDIFFKGENINELRADERAKLGSLTMDASYAQRYLNVGFSGGEKKKTEILQMVMLNPALVMLDETDSGLDIDAVKVVSENVEKFKSENKSILIITHHRAILSRIKPDYVHVLYDGKIVKTSDASLIDKIQKEGYSWVEQEV